ncbi:hypothetical protein GA829_15140 [Mesorhizobium sp. INR15]|nr:hypothetical protein GA829_15140 [Mesorhizobium sp. INR15]
MNCYSAEVCAAPHLPAGILSPYSDGERDSSHRRSANDQRCKKEAKLAASYFLPVTIRGEMPGRAMRGGAGIPNLAISTNYEGAIAPCK